MNQPLPTIVPALNGAANVSKEPTPVTQTPKPKALSEFPENATVREVNFYCKFNHAQAQGAVDSSRHHGEKLEPGFIYALRTDLGQGYSAQDIVESLARIRRIRDDIVISNDVKQAMLFKAKGLDALILDGVIKAGLYLEHDDIGVYGYEQTSPAPVGAA